MSWARVALGAVALAGLAPPCGGDETRAPDPSQERADRAVRPPPGWRTLENGTAGFTIAVPPAWTARVRRAATLIRSPDKLLALTIAADRSEPGRTTPPPRYASLTIRELSGLDPAPIRRRGGVRGSPYETATVEATTRRLARVRQRVSVSVFRRPGQVTYAAVAFMNARYVQANYRTLRRMLATLRARPPGP